MRPNIRPDCLRNSMRKSGMMEGRTPSFYSNRIMSGVLSKVSGKLETQENKPRKKKNVKKAKVLRPQIVQKELGTTSLFQSYLLSESNSGYVDFCNIRICAVIK